MGNGELEVKAWLAVPGKLAGGKLAADHFAKGFGVVSLAVEFAFTAETTDESFATEDGAPDAGIGFADAEAETFFKCDDVPGIHHIFTVYVNFVDTAEGIE